MKKFNIENILKLYAVTPEHQDVVSLVSQVLGHGITCVQYRAKQNASSEIARELLNLCHNHNIPLLINDDIYLAQEIHADGVHIGQNDVSCSYARKLLGPNVMIGVSVQTLHQAVQAEKDGADYLGVGSVFSTSTKQDALKVPFSTLHSITTSTHIPSVAIGGIHENNIIKLSHSGCAGIALVSALFSTKNPADSAEKIAELIKKVEWDAKPYGAYIIDFDGTLFDSMNIWKDLAIDYLASFGRQAKPDLRDKLINWGLRDGISFLQKEYKLNCSFEEALQRFSELLSQKYLACHLKKGVQAFANYIRRNNIHSCIATAGDSSALHNILQQNNLLESFDPIYSTSDIGLDKTSPKFFYRILEILGASLQRSVVFEDAPFALKSAKQAGLRAIQMYDEFWSDYKDVEFDLKLHSFLDIF